MPLKTCISPTIEMIRARQIGEGPNYEFKGRLDLSDRKVKSDFINDVVAFLNAEPGHLIVGVHEKKGAFEHFEPISGDPDAICRQFTSTVQDNIDPKPLGVGVRLLDVEGGFIVDVGIPEHRRRPYQNRINGAFYIRTGAQNTPIRHDQVHAMFITEEQYENDVLKLIERENRAIRERDMLDESAVTLHIGIVPFEHYDRGRKLFDPGSGCLKTVRGYHSGNLIFRECDNGVEASNTTSRLFIADDWLIHAYVTHLFVTDASGRVTIHEFKAQLTGYLKDLAKFLRSEDILGPFCVHLAVCNMQRDSKIAWVFPNAKSRALPRGYITEQLDNDEMIKRFHDMIMDASRYGRG